MRIDSPVPFPGSAGVLRGQEAEFNDDSSIIIRARWTLRVTYHLYIVTSDDIVMKFLHWRLCVASRIEPVKAASSSDPRNATEAGNLNDADDL